MGENVTGLAGDAHAQNCLNCGAKIAREYCGNCGQHAHIHHNMGAILHDLMHGVLHLDGAFLRTLPMLFFKPGRLTRNYIDGQRKKYMSPIGMFLFAFFLLFICNSYVFKGDSNFVGQAVDGIKSANLEQTIDKIAEEKKILEKERLKALEERKVEIDKEIKILDNARDNITPLEEVSGFKEEKITIKGDPEATILTKKIVAKINNNPELMFYKIKSGFYKFPWILILLSMPFMWIITFTLRAANRPNFYEHSVFVTYSISFMCMFLVVLEAFALIFPAENVYIIGAFAAAVHLYKQLKYGYGYGRFGAILRTILMFFSIILIIALFAIFLFAMTII